MAELSFLWTTGGAGDGAATYTRVDWAKIAKILGAASDEEGVVPGLMNALVGSVTALNTVQIGTGGALGDGKPYWNDAPVDVNIPSAVGAGNTRIDRVLLRVNWTAQTIRIFRLAGVDAASPSAPAITQTTGVTWDVMLYRATVNTSGTVTLVDERVYAQTGTGSLAANSVTNPVLRDSAALSVIGRSANSTGDPADIAAAADGNVLRRSGTTLGFGTVATDGLANLAVTSDKLATNSVIAGKIAAGAVQAADLAAGAINSSTAFAAGVVDPAALATGAVTAGKIATGGVSASAQIANDVIDSQHYVDGSIDLPHLANDVVDDTKVGNRVPQFYRRQGGASTGWATQGTTTYTPGFVRMQAGVIRESASATGGSVAVVFPVAFGQIPLVLVTPADNAIFNPNTLHYYLRDVTATGFNIYWVSDTNLGSVDFNWLAIGTE